MLSGCGCVNIDDRRSAAAGLLGFVLGKIAAVREGRTVADGAGATLNFARWRPREVTATPLCSAARSGRVSGARCGESWSQPDTRT